MPENLTLSHASLITRQEAAHRLDISLRKLDHLVAEGKLRPIKQSRSWVRFRVSDIDAFIERLLRQPEE